MRRVRERRGPTALLCMWLALVCVLLAGCGSSSPAASTHVSATNNPGVDPGTPLGGRPAPNFSLTDQFGNQVSLSQFRGKAVILAFVDSRCTTICPLSTASMVQALGLLGPAARRVQLIGVDANPQATRVADVRQYSVAHDMMHQWDFLTGSLPALKRVWKHYNVFVQAVAQNIDHEPAIYLIRPDGGEQMLFLTQMSFASIGAQAQVLADATAATLPGHPSTRTPAAAGTVHPVTPTTSLSLPVVAGTPARGAVRIGPGHPHLFVFFASWTAQTSNLTGQLSGLNQYARVAGRRGWPPLLAVDEATTEPSQSALGRALARVPGKLDYPVAMDRSGAVADGLHVGGDPWEELVSSTGKILFTNDGWFPSPALLDHAVQRALRP